MGTQETKVYIAILIAAAVIGVILVYFTINIFRQQKSNFQLYTSKIQAEISTLEKERSRVARDLHDDFAPLLTAVKYQINSMSLSESEDVKALEKSNGILDSMINRIREISNDLLPEALLRKGIVTALEESIRNIHADDHLNIEFKYSNIPAMTFEKSVNIYRIIQEVLHNTIKHAGAEVLSIEMKSEGPLLFIMAEDNGRGFDFPSEAKDFSGLGLRSMLSRADILNGRMYLDSKAGKGTRYIFEIPL